MLNHSKGAAVWVSDESRHSAALCSYSSQGPRAQIDRTLYKRHMQGMLDNYPGLDIKAGSVFDLVLDQSMAEAGRWAKVTGVKLGMSALQCYVDVH